jgi:hypothetical protein
MTHEIKVRVPAETLFNYVTQPWLWHEWHPSSRSASAGHSFLATGDQFEEVIELRPLSPLPPRLLRKVSYTVTEAVPEMSWQAEGKLKNGWLRIRYDLDPAEETGAVTHFQRTLTFGTTGAMRLMQPFLRLKMKRISAQAMRNLKKRLERM